MKKSALNLFVIVFLLGTYVGVSQTLNQATSWPNAGWTLSGTYTAGALVSNPTGVGATFTWDDDIAGNFSLDDDLQVTSPVIDLTAASGAGETWITISGDFVYRASGDVLAIETYDADTMTWTVLQAFSGNSSNTNYKTCATTRVYTSAILDISGFTATQLSGFQYRFTYDDLGGWQWGFCITSPTITSALPCVDPTTVTLVNFTDTTANLGWTENGSATLWDVEIVTTGTPPTGTPTATGVTNPYLATGLTADAEYDFYVRADCGVNGISNWTTVFTFRHTCIAITAPYTEDFETFTPAVDVAFAVENCWTGTGGAYFWEAAAGTDAGSFATGPAASITTGNYFYTEASAGADGDITDLVSPLVDLSALAAPGLTFNYHMFGSEIGTLDILVNGTTNVFTISGEQQTSETTPWVFVAVDLAAYAGQSITITFRGTSVGIFNGDISIDNVSFTEFPTCIDPSMLTATNITGTTADLGWTENSTATAWDIEIIDITAGGMATGTPTTLGVSNPFTATGLTHDNDFSFYVRSDCGSAWVGPFSFATPYVAVPPTCSGGVFLDSGGMGGRYSNNENITYTICPDNAGDFVNVEFTLFSTENSLSGGCLDGLTIHNGVDTMATTIDPPGGGTIWCWDEADVPAAGTGDLEGMTITSSDASGCLTFVFTSDTSFYRDGWEANITCSSLSVESVEVRGFLHYVDTVNNNFVVNAQSNISSIEVYNLVGQIIATAKPNAASGEANLGSVKNGIYFARVTLENGRSSVVKFVK